MPDLTVKPDLTTISEERKIAAIGHTSCALGNILELLERNFPDYDPISSIKSGLAGEPPGEIWGMPERGHSLGFMRRFIGERDVIPPLPLSELEPLRQESNFPARYSFTPRSLIVHVETMEQVIFALLFYYSVSDLTLHRCQHCGRWFASKSLKTKFCERISPVSGEIMVERKRQRTCGEVVHDARYVCGRLRNSIRTKAAATTDAQLYQSSFLLEFEAKNDELYDKANKFPTAENWVEYHRFLKETNREKKWLD